MWRAEGGRVRAAPAARHAFHQVECAGDDGMPAISLHIYGVDIGRLERDMWDDQRQAFIPFSSSYTNDRYGLPPYFSETTAAQQP